MVVEGKFTSSGRRRCTGGFAIRPPPTGLGGTSAMFDRLINASLDRRSFGTPGGASPRSSAHRGLLPDPAANRLMRFITNVQVAN